MVGFHARASDVLVQVPDCQLLLPEIVSQIPMLESLSVMSASRKAEVGLTVTHSGVGLDVLVQTGQTLTPQLRVALAAFAQDHRLARLTWNDETVVTLHAPAQSFGTAQVTPPPGAFLQATQQGEATLGDAVQEIVGPSKSVVDLFAGCGTFTLPLAARSEVHAVEGLADMLLALDSGWRKATGLKRVTTETRDLFRRPLLPDELERFDAAVIDPPRAGAEAQIAALADSGVARIAMVSCNPVTFARDAATLCNAGYDLTWVQVVDQFRWSSHVEVVAAFTRL
jgi:23S rRNA (uracil1939-C5)-methyltransferase